MIWLYTTKVLFAYSERNSKYGKSHAEFVSSAYPNVELVEIKDTGHEIPHYGWENFYPTYIRHETNMITVHSLGSEGSILAG